VAAGPFSRTRRRLDLGGDYFHRPDSVSHLGGNGAEDLAAFLRAFPGIGDYFYSMLRSLYYDRCKDRFWFDANDNSGHGQRPRLPEKACMLQFFLAASTRQSAISDRVCEGFPANCSGRNDERR